MRASGPGASDTTQTAPDASESIGAYLATQRKLRGVSLDELGIRTRIPLRSLERLESGAFDGQPDGFVRGFVRTVAEGLGLDPDDTVMRMMDEPPASRSRRSGIAAGPRMLLAALVLAGLVVLSGLGVRAAARVLFAGGEPVEPVLRRDPVRELAEAAADAPAARPPVSAPPPAGAEPGEL